MKSERVEIKQLFPEKKLQKLEGLYLSHDLRGIAEKLKRPVVIANYASDVNDVIAKRNESGEFRVPKEIKNSSDWRLFQELTAQADIIITGAGYMNRFKKLGKGTQNILTQFDKDGEFAKLGEWRLKNGYKSRNPDIAILSRSLDFDIPEVVTKDGRKVFIFTTYSMDGSDKANKLERPGVEVLGVGKDGVDGARMINKLGFLGYKVIKMTTGPRVLKILLDASVLDRLYITQVQRELLVKNRDDVQTILMSGEKIVDSSSHFKLTHEYEQEDVTTSDGEKTSQKFFVYDSLDFLSELSKNPLS